MQKKSNTKLINQPIKDSEQKMDPTTTTSHGLLIHHRGGGGGSGTNKVGSPQSEPIQHVRALAPRRFTSAATERLVNIDGKSIPAQVARAINDWVFPPTSPFYSYQKAIVGRSSLLAKWLNLALTMLFLGLLGSPAILIAVERQVRSVVGINKSTEPKKIDEVFLDPMWYLVIDPLLRGVMVAMIFWLMAYRLYKQYYIDRRDQAVQWKIQPYSFPSPQTHRLERRLTMLNAFLAGWTSTLYYNMYMLGFHNLVGLYTNVSDHPGGFLYFVISPALLIIALDLWTFLVHLVMHKSTFLYKHVHKLHHRFKSPTPFTSLALHPVEFLLFDFGGLAYISLVPTHTMAYLVGVTFLAYRNSLGHSGIAFEGGLPFFATSKFHDDHHALHEVNYGNNFLVWDRLWGSLRRRGPVAIAHPSKAIAAAAAAAEVKAPLTVEGESSSDGGGKNVDDDMVEENELVQEDLNVDSGSDDDK
jgi:lathosterol oxidase